VDPELGLTKCTAPAAERKIPAPSKNRNPLTQSVQTKETHKQEENTERL
jgi:hypothetical protein